MQKDSPNFFTITTIITAAVSPIGRHGRGHAPNDDGDRFASRARARAPGASLSARRPRVGVRSVPAGTGGVGWRRWLRPRPAPPQVSSSSGGGRRVWSAGELLRLMGNSARVSLRCLPRLGVGWCGNAGDPVRPRRRWVFHL